MFQLTLPSIEHPKEPKSRSSYMGNIPKNLNLDPHIWKGNKINFSALGQLWRSRVKQHIVLRPSKSVNHLSYNNNISISNTQANLIITCVFFLTFIPNYKVCHNIPFEYGRSIKKVTTWDPLLHHPHLSLHVIWYSVFDYI